MKSNRRGSYKRKTTANRGYSANRKRRSYRKNVGGSAYKTELMQAFKFGVIVTGGYMGHRVLTNVIDKYGLAKVEMFQKGAAGDFRNVIAGVLVALVGVPLAVRMLPKDTGAVAAAGIMSSLVHGIIVSAIKKSNNPELLEAVSNYANAEGYPQYSGYGAYYEFQPHQIYNGANGLGNSHGQMLTQAAAGYGMGEFYEVGAQVDMYGGQPLEQAAAGMGAPLQQMYANGTGEYYAYGMEGIGEYMTAPHEGGPEPYIAEGVMPNLHSAEQALNVAEAASGMGGFGNVSGQMLTQAAAGLGDVPLQSEVDPMIRALDIPDVPGGSRAGILAGGDGIFG